MEIINQICRRHGITREHLSCSRRDKNILAARLEAASTLRAAGYSYPQIGSIMGMCASSIQKMLKRPLDA